MKRTLREWRTLWEDWDSNDYAELDALFMESDRRGFLHIPPKGCTCFGGICKNPQQHHKAAMNELGGKLLLSTGLSVLL